MSNLENLKKQIQDPEQETCICWNYNINRQYGRVYFRGNTRNAHIAAYVLTYGEIPEGHQIRHKCKTKTCINPLHLETGTPKQNCDDRKRDNTHLEGEKHPDSILSEKDVLNIHKSWKKGVKVSYLAKQYGVAHTAISRIIHGKNWKHLNLDFSYRDTIVVCKQESEVLTRKHIFDINEKWRQGICMSRLSKEYNVSIPALSRIKTGKTWKHLELVWIR